MSPGNGLYAVFLGLGAALLFLAWLQRSDTSDWLGVTSLLFTFISLPMLGGATAGFLLRQFLLYLKRRS